MNPRVSEYLTPRLENSHFSGETIHAFSFSLTVLLASLSSIHAFEPAADKTLLDVWDVVYLKNSKAGFVHTITKEIVHDGRKLLQTTVEQRLTLKRNDNVIELKMDTGNLETSEGKVVGVFMRQYLGKNKTLDLKGTVVGDELRMVADQNKPVKAVPWNDKVVGMYRQQLQLQDKQVKRGDLFHYLSFEPTLNLVVFTLVLVKDFEEVELFAGKQKKRLLRVETRIDKVEKVQMPLLVTWLGDDHMQARSEVDVPGLGVIVMYRTTKELATAPVAPDSLTDIGLSQVVPVKQRIDRPYATSSAVYRITLQGENEPASAFSRDDRQEIKNVRGNTFELHVKAGKAVGEEKIGAEKASSEYIQSSYFITSADERVKQHARNAVEKEKDLWKKAVLIEKWVHEHMQVKNYEALATADHVARTLEGDCTEFAMLMAAMCRAEGIPSRTALGLVYTDVKDQPGFAFHMWTEVFVKGRWVPLDAMLGQGGIGATHLKIADQSWHEVRTMAPLLPVVRVLGRLSIDEVRVENIVKP